MHRIYRIPIMVGRFVRTLELTLLPSLGIVNGLDTRRVVIVDTQDWRSIELSIQAVEQLATWWINHGPIPKEQIKAKEGPEL